MNRIFLAIKYIIFLILPLVIYIVLTIERKPINWKFLFGIAVFWVVSWIILDAERKDTHSELNLSEVWIFLCGIQIVWIPIVMSVSGVSNYRLHRIVPTSDFEFALVLQWATHFFAAIGFRLMQSKPHKLAGKCNENELFKYLLISGIVGVCCLFFLKFTNHNSVLGIFSSESNFILKFLAISLSPCLFYSFVSWHFLNLMKSKWNLVFLFKNILFCVLSLYPLTFLNLNRAVIFVPLLSFLLLKIPPQKSSRNIVIWMAILSISVGLLGMIAEYRAKLNVTQNYRFSESSAGHTPNPGLSQTIQIYANSAQYLGYGVHYIDRNEWSFFTPLVSLLEPLPKFDYIRDNFSSSTTMFNRAVYENTKTRDLYFSSIGEIFLSFGIVGLFLFSLVIGRTLRRIRNTVYTTSIHFKKFILIFLFVWLMTYPVFSISILSQVFFYQVIPALTLLSITSKKNYYES